MSLPVLTEQDLSLDHLIPSCPIPLVLIDSQDRIVFINDAATQMLLIPAEQLLLQPLQWLNQGADTLQLVHQLLQETRRLKLSQSLRLAWLGGYGMRYYRLTSQPHGAYISLYFEDISALVEAERALRSQAVRDPLTCLFNRQQAFLMGTQELARSRRYHTPLAILVVRVDNMRDINQTYGYALGDHALICLSRLLQTLLRDADYAARLDDRQFIICLPDTNAQQARLISQRILNTLKDNQITMADHTIPACLSSGSAQFNSERDTLFDDLLLRAEQDCYRHAKG